MFTLSNSRVVLWDAGIKEAGPQERTGSRKEIHHVRESRLRRRGYST
jgi:hypothetical protein